MEKSALSGYEGSEQKTYSLQTLADSRVQALKSLASMLVKELEILERLTASSVDLPADRKTSLYDELGNFELEMIRTALLKTRGHQRNAARLLGIKVTTLHAKLKRYSLDSRDFGYVSLRQDDASSIEVH